MGQIATNQRQITLFCIESSVRAKQTLAYAKSEGVSVLIVDVSKTPITGTQICEIANRLRVKVKDLIDWDNILFNSKQEPLNLSSEDWTIMIRRNPEILKQPIALWGGKATLVTTPTDILQF